MKLKSTLWVIPFISFLLGYFILRFIFLNNKKITVPTVIGLQLKDAVKILSDSNLNTKIIAEKKDEDLPDSTVLTQNPYETEIKPLQSIYITISKKPPRKTAPNYIKKDICEIHKHAKKNNIKVKQYCIPSSQKENSCVLQYPKYEEPLEDNRITVFLSLGNKKKVIFPDLRGLDLENAKEFLNLYSIEPNIIQEKENGKGNVILDQRPLPGSIVDLEKINVQLKI